VVVAGHGKTSQSRDGKTMQIGKKRKKRTGTHIISGRWVIFTPKAAESRGRHVLSFVLEQKQLLI
jgi:hypothetical protein